MAADDPTVMRLNFDKFLDDLLRGKGGIVWQAAVINVAEGAVVVCSENLELWQDEVDHLTQAVRYHTLHKSMFSIGWKQYMVTSVQPRSFYGRSIDDKDPGGVVVIETLKVIFVVTFKDSHNRGYAPQVIPYVINFAEKLINL